MGDVGDEGMDGGPGDVRPRENIGTTSCAGVQRALQTGQEGWVESHCWRYQRDGCLWN